MAGTDTPIPRARVTMTPPPGTGPETVVTDAAGRFTFSGVATGRYTLTASKLGYVWPWRTAADEPEPGITVDVLPDEIAQVVIRLLEGAAITGRVTTDLGEPAVGTTVTAMRPVRTTGIQRLVPWGRSATTDDRGEYRIAELPPGSYYVAAAGSEADLWVRDSTASPSLTPVYRYGRRYHPGATSPAGAHPVLLAEGEEAAGIDVGLRLGRVATVSGTVRDATGTPATATLYVAVRDDLAREDAMATQLRAGGSVFELRLDPGEHILIAQGLARTPGIAARTIHVAGDDLEDVDLIIRAGGTLTGRIEFEGRTPRPRSWPHVHAAYYLPDQERIVRWPALPGTLGLTAARIDPSGRFELQHLIGTRILQIDDVPPGWVLEGVFAGDRDLTDVPVVFSGDERLDDLRVVLSDRAAAVEGLVLHQSRPVPAAPILIFPADRSVLSSSRRIRLLRTDNRGRFSVVDLPPGGYSIVAVHTVDAERWPGREYLESLRPHATRVELSGNRTASLDLQLLVLP